MKIILVNTDRFIEEMGDFGFIRIDKYTGVNGNNKFITMYPPELDKNFIANLINNIRENLK